MLLLFSEDEVADEVPRIVWTNHTALFRADAFYRSFFVENSHFLRRLIGFAICRCAIYEPIGGLLLEMVATQ